MIHFEWPWLILIAPLPWLVRRISPPMDPAAGPVLRVPHTSAFEVGLTGSISTQGQRWLLGLLLAIWVCLVAAMMRPQWIGEPVDAPATGRDLLLAVDLSGSMEIADFELRGRAVDRLTATKSVGIDFIDRRVGDRLGLILFGRQAYLQAPLTFDRHTVRQLLEEAVIGLAGKETAIGDAIGLAVKRLRETDGQRVLILLTDGANTAGEITPLRAAELAAKEGLKIYTIGIGAREQQIRTLLGTRRFNPAADLDERTLTAIATATGGRYFRAHDTEELEQIYQLLDKLEPVELDEQRFRAVSALYPWPLSIALLLAAALLLVSRRAVR
jgi:Ca-activated chloride channel family protein